MGFSLVIATPPITLNTLLTAFQTGPLSILSLVLEIVSVIAYLGGVSRLRKRGRSWSRWRTTAFISGIFIIFFATGSGFASYDDSNFTMHVIQHMLLMNFAPLSIALSAPITLLVQASSRSIQTKVIKTLHSKVVSVVTFPVLLWLGNLVTMYVYFETSVYQLSIDHPLFHDYTHLHFFLVGYLFWSTVIGIDPSRWRLPLGARFLFVLTGIPFSAFLGISLMSASKTISPLNTLIDVHSGGGVLWAFGEISTVTALIVLAVQWAKHDAKEAARLDRALDRARDGSMKAEGL